MALLAARAAHVSRRPYQGIRQTSRAREADQSRGQRRSFSFSRRLAAFGMGLASRAGMQASGRCCGCGYGDHGRPNGAGDDPGHPARLACRRCLVHLHPCPSSTSPSSNACSGVWTVRHRHAPGPRHSGTPRTWQAAQPPLLDAQRADMDYRGDAKWSPAPSSCRRRDLGGALTIAASHNAGTCPQQCEDHRKRLRDRTD